MSKYKYDDRVRITQQHPRPQYHGRKGTVVGEPVRVEVGTAGIPESSLMLPPGKPQWVYQIEMDNSSCDPIQCNEDWLKAT